MIMGILKILIVFHKVYSVKIKGEVLFLKLVGIMDIYLILIMGLALIAKEDELKYFYHCFIL